MQRSDSVQALLPVQIQTVLEFLNKAQSIEAFSNIRQYRPDLSEEDLVVSINPAEYAISIWGVALSD